MFWQNNTSSFWALQKAVVLNFCRPFAALLLPIQGLITFARVYGRKPHTFFSWRSARVFWPSFLEWPFDRYPSLSLKFTTEPWLLSSLFRESTRCLISRSTTGVCYHKSELSDTEVLRQILISVLAAYYLRHADRVKSAF